MAAAKVGDNVTLDYEGKLPDGSVFDSSHASGSLRFRLGEGRVFKPVEAAVVGMSPGESKTVDVPATEAFGAHSEDLVVELSRERFPDDLQPEIGKRLQIPRKEGGKLVATITEVSDAKITLDANHPLAGRDLTIDLKLLKVG
jgi:peptidylprolyl isomerase